MLTRWCVVIGAVALAATLSHGQSVVKEVVCGPKPGEVTILQDTAAKEGETMTLEVTPRATDRKWFIDLDAHENPEMVKAAFLGVAARPGPEVLTRQLKLPDGVGLVIEMVEDGSPAAAAGLQKNDVLHRLNDQLIINPEQLRVLVRTFKGGDTVKLTVIREGTSKVLDAKLVEKEMPKLSMGGPEHHMPMPGAPMGPPMGREGFMRLMARPQGEMPHEEIEGLTRALLNELPEGGAGVTRTTTYTVSDKGRSATATVTDGKTTLKVVDIEAKKTLFDGPINTADEKKKIPAEVMPLVDKLMFVIGGEEKPRGMYRLVPGGPGSREAHDGPRAPGGAGGAGPGNAPVPPPPPPAGGAGA